MSGTLAANGLIKYSSPRTSEFSRRSHGNRVIRTISFRGSNLRLARFQSVRLYRADDKRALYSTPVIYQALASLTLVYPTFSASED